MTAPEARLEAAELASALADAETLLRATERLGRAIHDDDFENLEAALEARQRSFVTVVHLAERDLPSELRTALARVSALDQKILAAARDAHGEARAELESLATARRAARAFLPDRNAQTTARFVAERV